MKSHIITAALIAAGALPALAATPLSLSTDKALYAPGDTVRFSASEPLRRGSRVTYRHGADIVATVPVSGNSWEWLPPTADYQGYLAEVTGPDKRQLATIAVDVSSDWKMFPRYGFVATFDASKLQPGLIDSEIDYLNRCHINGVQFQDWHWKHHRPLGGTPENPLDEYKDIALRTNNTEVIRRYIDASHLHGMKTIFYNLCLGALDDAAADGVKEEWYLFTDPEHKNRDIFDLPDGWKSDIFFVDPANPGWLEYIGNRNDEVYRTLPFDGYQIDQVGQRGVVYNYDGEVVDLATAYRRFINAMKRRHPSKRLIMNAVASFGHEDIAGSGDIDFCYNETWAGESQFSDLRDIIAANDRHGRGQVKTVFASYMNYDKAGRQTGLMNTPGVIMTDAVMMALGGSHLELGDHMLSREYFAAAPLAMTDTLKEAMVRYYDFMTAYQNLLRGSDTSDEITVDMTTSHPALQIAAWPPRKGSLTTYGRKTGDRQVISLLNFLNAPDVSWRDLEGTWPAPLKMRNIPASVAIDRPVTRVWTASPDRNGGVPEDLQFTVTDDGSRINFTLPALEYWDMIVIE